MKYSTKLLSQSIVHSSKIHEIKHIVISPGSRNAPLTIGFTEDSFFNCYSIVDERCAAFFALGIAQQTNEPVALVCTSGSALLNYYPAIAEAYYSDIPLLIYSADRPKSLINIGDGQTIMQENIYSNHIVYSLSCKENDEAQSWNNQEIQKAICISKQQKGPVHINIPFSEPLYHTTDRLLINTDHYISEEKDSEYDYHSDSYLDFISKWNSSKRKMILVGVLAPNSIENDLLNRLAKDESVIVLTETTSNLYHQNFFPSIDQLIAPLEEEGFKELQPEILLTIGGMVVSKKIKAFLRTYQPVYHGHIDSKKAFDTYFNLTHHFKDKPNTFLTLFLKEVKKVSSDYQKHWLQIKKNRLERHQEYVSQIPYSDFSVFSEIVAAFPSAVQLQISNSAAIRYMQLFGFTKGQDMFCNRGTSGIDGSTSTAIGAATVANKPVVFITGDLSFFYDSNALWNNYIPSNFKIIIINNGGGGIFRILPGEKNTKKFDTFFETKHSLEASYLASMYGFNYDKVENMEDLQKKLPSFLSNTNQPSLLEIFTPSTINDKILLDYFKFLK